MRPSPTLAAPAKLTTAAVLAAITAAFVLVLFGGSAQAYFSYTGSVPTQIGGPCTGEEGAVCEPGQLRSPTGVAKNTSTSLTDPSAGDVYVADPGDNRVSKFSATGEYLSELTGTPTGPGGTNVPFASVTAVAVDNSESPMDPSAGDVYVVDHGTNVIDKFNPAGQYVGQITSTSEDAFGEVFSVAVDPEGGVWVYASDNGIGFIQIDRFSNAVHDEYLSQFGTGKFVFETPTPVIAVDGNDVFITVAQELLKFTYGGLLAEHLTACGCVTGLAVGPVPGDVLATEAGSVVEYDGAANLLQQFGAFGAAAGIAVDSSGGDAYVADSGGGVVDVFAPSVLPDVTTEPASGFTPTNVTLNGVVSPDGVEAESCEFQYGNEPGVYESSVPCSPLPPYVGTSSVHVSAEVAGLQRGELYHYRLAAGNANGVNDGFDQTFVDPAAVSIDSESVVDVTPESATLEAQINPGGAETSYRFEYGTGAGYSTSVPIPNGELEAATSDQSVSEHLQGLRSGTLYHYRVVASSALGTVPGADHAFTTPTVSLGAVALLDTRAYELVSPPEKDGYQVETTESLTEGVDLPQASAEGTKVTYTTNGPVADPQSSGLGNQILSSRGLAGWSSQNISTPHQTATGITIGQGQEYSAFSSDLSLGAVAPFFTRQPSPEDTPLSPLAPPGYRMVYLRDNLTDSYEPLLTLSNKSSINLSQYESMRFVDATPDFSHVVVTTNQDNLYEWSAGQLQPVNVLPGGEESERSAVGGQNAISGDGSRVIWTDATGGGIYVRNTVTQTTTPIGVGSFRTASSDGSKIFFTVFNNGSETLYEYNLKKGMAIDLTVDTNPADGDEAKVEGVLGASQDGSSVYFVAKGALEDDKGRLLRTPDGGQPISGADNLYLLHEEGEAWTTSFIATLSEGDASDWSGNLANNGSRVTHSGQYLAFGSSASLTGYDNRDARTGRPDQEMFVYDADTQRLTCASCDPTGAQPIGSAGMPAAREIGVGRGATYLPRDLSEEGRLFFDSADSLVPHDTDGTQDVYEWEPSGVGSCQTAAGCLGLISGGTGANPSSFIDASASGDDVFFTTSDRLVPQDFDDSYDVYDAHVCSASAPCIATPAVQAPCVSTDACRAGPLPQPGVFGAPPSATFSGAGNLTAPAPSIKAKPKAKPTKCRKGYVKKKGRCVKKPKPKKSIHHGRGSR